MRISLNFTAGGNSRLKLPIHYNQILQGFIYGNLKKELADFLHNKGYLADGRSFKLFTFSRLNGRYILGNGNISFEYPVNFTISSPVGNLLSEFANCLLKRKNLIR